MASFTATLFLPFLIFSLTSAIEDQQEIKAKPGDDVTLQCQSPRGEAIILLEWSRPELKKDGYVFFYRNERSHENYQHTTVVGRVQLGNASSMKDGNTAVILKNVTINDSGRYECRIIISNTEGRERDAIEFKQFIQLTVTDSGHTAGNTWTEGDNNGGDKDGGNKDGGDKDVGDKDGGDKDGYNRTPVVLSVITVILILLILGLVGLMILRKHKERTMISYQPPETGNSLQQV